MKVFISWSGERSRAVAEALHDWLPSVIQAVDPWMSASDIEKGTRWRSGLANELDQSSASIICITPENLEAPWIHFEAGALSKQQQNTYVCTFLFGLKPVDIRDPLAQFQATTADREDIRKLIHTINRILNEAALSEGKINEAFDVWWPKLEQKLNSIPILQKKLSHQTNPAQSQQEGVEHSRDIREILGEILNLVREQSRINYKSKGRPVPIDVRLPSTLDWDDEEARLLFQYYIEEPNKRRQYRLATDEEYARYHLKKIRSTTDPSFKIVTGADSLKALGDFFASASEQKKEQVDENVDS